MKILFQTILTMFLVMGLTACSAGSGDGISTITIGAVLDLSGPQAQASWAESVELAVEHANQGLKDAGERRYRFALVIADSASIEELGTQYAIDLAADGAKCIVGSSSSNSIQINAVLNYDDLVNKDNNLNIPVICGACQSSKINDWARTDSDPKAQASMQDRDHWMFRSIPKNKREADIIVREKLMTRGTNGDFNNDGVFKVSVYGSNSATGGAFTKEVKKAVQTHAEGIIPYYVEENQYDRDANPVGYNYNELMNKLTDDTNTDPLAPDPNDIFNPDAIVGDALPLFEAGLTQAYLDGGHEDIFFIRRAKFRSTVVLETIGALANGFEGLSVVLASDSQSGPFFLNAIQTKTGKPAELSDTSFYDAAIVMMLAATAAAHSLEEPTTVTGRAIADALYEINDKAAGAVMVYAGPDEFRKAVEAIYSDKTIDYDGAGCPMDFTPRPAPDAIDPPDSGGEVNMNLAYYEVIEQAFVETQLLDCFADDWLCPPKQ